MATQSTTGISSTRVDVEISGLWLAVNVDKQDGKIVDPAAVALCSTNEVPKHSAVLAMDAVDIPKGSVTAALKTMAAAPGAVFAPLNGDIVSIVSQPAGVPTHLLSFDTVAVISKCFPAWKSKTFDSQYVPASGGRPSAAVVSAFFLFGAGDLGATDLTRNVWEFTGSGAAVPPARDHFAQTIVYTFDVPGTVVTVQVSPLNAAPGSAPALSISLVPANGQSVRVRLLNFEAPDLPSVLNDQSAPMKTTSMTSHFRELYHTKLNAPAGPDPHAKGPVVRSPTGGLCGPGYGGP